MKKKSQEKIKWSAPWKVRLFILKILEKKKSQSTDRSVKKKEWNDVIEMKLTTVRLLHCMQGLEEFRKKFFLEKKYEISHFSAHSTLKAADILENAVSFRKKKK